MFEWKMTFIESLDSSSVKLCIEAYSKNLDHEELLNLEDEYAYG